MVTSGLRGPDFTRFNIMNILFVCSANKDRSRTAEIHFQHKYPEMRFRSAGINQYLSKKHGGVYLERYMLDQATRIICMEKEHANHILKRFDGLFADRIEILNLGDTEPFMATGLIAMLEEKFILYPIQSPLL